MTWQTHSTQDELLKRVCVAYCFEVISIDGYLFLLPHSNQSAFAALMANSREDRPNFKLMHMPFAAKEMLVWAMCDINGMLYGKNDIELAHKILCISHITYRNADEDMQYVRKDNPLHHMSYEEACMFIDMNA